MKVIVTGGAGYIGSHTIIEIQNSKPWSVVSLDNYLNSSASTYDRIEQITHSSIERFDIDLSDRDKTLELFSKIGGIDGIIHFAALKAVGESVEKPLLYYRNNLESLLNMIECCKQFNIPRLIFSSSCSIYGNVDKLPVDESSPLAKAESPYAATKAIGEEILKHAVKELATKVISLRYFNPVGAHESGLNGENPINKPNNLVPVITQFASGIIKEMYVHGTDYSTRDGSCVRDYIHVTDIANAHIKALEYCDKMNAGELEYFNLGTGDGVSVLEAINAFEKISGKNLDYKLGPRRPGDVESIYSDSSKAKKLLNWSAQHDINSMMKSAWKWQQHLNSELND